MPGKNVAQLLVEGENDRHVVWHLCQVHNVPETFSVEILGDNGGVDALLRGLPVRLKISGLTVLGVVLDADQNLEARWQAVKTRLLQAGYSSLPEMPSPEGTIIQVAGKPKVGLWLMPDNRLPGMLEDFVAHLIPAGDALAPKANAILDEIERENLNRYSENHRAKAFIHTWLAWQETPGRPMGQAITARVLNHNEPLAQNFVNWLNRLFNQ